VQVRAHLQTLQRAQLLLEKRQKAPQRLTQAFPVQLCHAAKQAAGKNMPLTGTASRAQAHGLQTAHTGTAAGPAPQAMLQAARAQPLPACAHLVLRQQLVCVREEGVLARDHMQDSHPCTALRGKHPCHSLWVLYSQGGARGRGCWRWGCSCWQWEFGCCAVRGAAPVSATQSGGCVRHARQCQAARGVREVRAEVPSNL